MIYPKNSPILARLAKTAVALSTSKYAPEIDLAPS
jgi:hypothetical protein